MPDNASMCENFRRLRDAQHDMGDQVQRLIDELIEELRSLLGGEYLSKFEDALGGATMAERLKRIEAARAHLIHNLRRLLSAFHAASAGGAPLDPWPNRALGAYSRLIMLLQALIMLRDLEDAFDTMEYAWCRDR